MAYEDWPEQIQEVYLNAIAFSWLTPEYGTYATGQASEDDIQTAEALFESGWVDMPPGEAGMSRDEFYAYVGIDDGDIDWDAWREFWGY